jgi:hypothetical protein
MSAGPVRNSQPPADMNGDVAQLVECPLSMREVRGSKPRISRALSQVVALCSVEERSWALLCKQCEATVVLLGEYLSASPAAEDYAIHCIAMHSNHYTASIAFPTRTMDCRTEACFV